MAQLTIIQALGAEQLFGPWFKAHPEHGDSWRAWRVFLKATYALKMDAAELTIYRKHTGRENAPAKPFREVYAQVGRRGGKSMVASLVGIFQACFVDHQKNLYPGEKPLVMILAADKRQAAVILGFIKGFFQEIPHLRAVIESQKPESIRLLNGVKLEVHTSSFKRTRGYTVCAAICDEIAFWSDADSKNPAAEVINAIKPAMLTIKGSLLLCISSPYSKRGLLYESWRKNWGLDGARALYWRASTLEMNPSADAEEIESAYQDDPARARAEYGGEFREDLESLFTAEMVEGVVERGVYERPYDPRHRYRGFVDPSGGRGDSFCLGISHHENGKAILDVLRETQSPFSPEVATNDFCEVLKHYNLREVVGDSYAAEYSAELFQKHGIRYIPSDKSRSELYLELLPMMMSGRVQLLDSRKLLNQLVGLERRTGRGADIVDHVAGSHDDLSNACAGALVGVMPKTSARMNLALLDSGRMSWMPGDPIAGAESGAQNGNGNGAPAATFSARAVEYRADGKCCATPLYVRRGAIWHCNACGNETSEAWPMQPPAGQRKGV